MRADYHLHPNLQGKNSAKRLSKLWRAIEQHNIDAIVCAEHTFKNAPRAYRKFIKAKPKHMKTHIFPGAELVSSDEGGVDIIAFADYDWYDEHPRLLEPFAMTLREMLAYLEQSNLQYFVPHPYIFKNPLCELYNTTEEMRNFLNTVPAYEAFNGCFLPAEKLAQKLPLRKLKQNLRSRCQPTKEMLPERSWQFIAIGSDAHHPGDVGFSVDIPCASPRSRKEAFQRLIQNTDISQLHVPPMKRALGRMVRSTLTTSMEAATRRGLRFRNVMREFLDREEDTVLMTDIDMAADPLLETENGAQDQEILDY